MYFQKSLPRLPIPVLEKTCERYLAALRPLLNDETYNQTEKVVNTFKSSSGQHLQKLLKAHDAANKHTSYISEPWFDMYLRDRAPLPVNYNPVLIMNKDSKPEYNNQLIRAANLVISSLRFMRALRSEYLAPEVFHLNPAKSDNEKFRTITKLAPKMIATYVAYAFKAFPLDMSQYNGLFGATRIPELDKDRIYRNDKSRHLLVIRNGYLYSVNVLDQNGYIESPNVILGRLKFVLSEEIAENAHPIGILTTSDRNNWANLRQRLIENGNEEALSIVDSALFCLCFDNTVGDDINPIPVMKSFLAGEGTNRWYDKSFSILIGKDGVTAINFEHSWGDGVAVLRFFNEIYAETTTSPYIHPNSVPYSNDSENNVKRINFKIDDHIKKGIENAKNTHRDILDSLDMNFIRYTGITKDICKKNSVSPDSIMQLAFQLAFKMMYGVYVATYESCSTAAFRHGRTETMRPCTNATTAFCDLALSKNSSDTKTLYSMIRNCSNVHNSLTKEAAMGQGFDRHLFGLRYIAEINDIKKPSLFDDAGYEIINQNIISTSTLSSPGIVVGGFGPVVKDGFGLAYSIQNTFSGSFVTSYKGQRDGKQFVQCIESALNLIKNVLQSDKS